MKTIYLLFVLLPATVIAQQTTNPINPNSAALMEEFNKEFISTINIKRTEIGLATLVVNDSLTKLASHNVKIYAGIEKGDVSAPNHDHYFTGSGPAAEITPADIIKVYWLSSANGHFPGIKAHYTHIGIASILRQEDLLNYVIFK